MGLLKDDMLIKAFADKKNVSKCKYSRISNNKDRHVNLCDVNMMSESHCHIYKLIIIIWDDIQLQCSHEFVY